jgi:hypothetical protein
MISVNVWDRGLVEAQARIADGLFDRNDQAPVPDIDADHARFGYRNGGARQDRRRGAIGFNRDAFEQAGRGTAGAQAAEVILQGGDRFIHAVAVFGEIRLGHDWASLLFLDRDYCSMTV